MFTISVDDILLQVSQYYNHMGVDDLLQRVAHCLENARRNLADLSLDWQIPTYAVVYLITTTLLVYLFYRIISPKLSPVETARNTLHSLLVVITPTQSIWPSGYTSLAFRAATRSPKDKVSICLPLDMLYDDLKHGLVELRNPSRHLPLLLKGTFSTVTGVSIGLEAGVYWWSKLLGWILHCNFLTDEFSSLRLPITDLKESLSRHRNSSPPPPYGADGIRPSLDRMPLSSVFLHSIHKETPAISLDCVPYHCLESHLRRVQASLKPNSFLLLGFTTRAGSQTHSFWSKETVLTALPFLPRHALSGRQKTGTTQISPQRTTTVLYSSVTEVIQLLTSGTDPLTVEVVRNVSQEYAQFLYRSARELENDEVLRSEFVQAWGLELWVEERLCTVWEAALLDAGLLEGWAIVVRKPE